MLNLRRSLCSASPLIDSIYYSTKALKGRPPSARNSKPVRQRTFGANPGIDSQLSALQLDENELKDPEILDKFESQFWDSDKMHNMFEREKFLQKECVGLYQVVRKQFKEEKTPNMLLWDEKQEIKALYKDDPEKWTIFRLALSFPASPSIIQKILKSQWKLRSQEEIDRHDRRVRRNWKALAEDQLDIPNKELKDHLLSFSNRFEAASVHPTEVIIADKKKTDDNPTRNILKGGGVFANIYQSYRELHESKSGTTNDKLHLKEEKEDVIVAGLKTLHYPPENETFIIPKSVQNVKFHTNQPMTMEAMHKQILFDTEKGRGFMDDTSTLVQNQQEKLHKQRLCTALKDPVGTTSEVGLEKVTDSSPLPEDHHSYSEEKETHNGSMEKSLSETKMDLKLSNANAYIDLLKWNEHQERGHEEQRRAFQTAHLGRTAKESDAIVKAVKSYMSNSSESYPLNIKIPENVWKKGALYRIKDRFYTDDGEFLYRVPGLSKE